MKSLGKFSVKVLKVLGFTVLGLFSLLVLIAIFAPKPPKIPVTFSSYLVENDLGGKCDSSLQELAKNDEYVAGWKKATSPSLNKNWTYIAPFYVYKTTVNYKNDKGFVEHPAVCKFNEHDFVLSSRYDKGRITYFKKTPQQELSRALEGNLFSSCVTQIKEYVNFPETLTEYNQVASAENWTYVKSIKGKGNHRGFVMTTSSVTQNAFGVPVRFDWVCGYTPDDNRIGATVIEKQK